MRLQFLGHRWPWFVAACVAIAAFLSSFVEFQLPSDWDRRPWGSVDDIALLKDRGDLNVLFILIDTLRAERLGSYGSQRDTSPVLDQLAASGVRFERNLAQSSWTKASMASLWTGLYPARTGITRYDDVIPAEAVSAVELLRDAGFNTVGLYRNGWVAPTFGFDQGFEVYQRPTPKPLPAKARRENPTLGDTGTDESVVDEAVEFLRVNGQHRWFLYLHLMDLHEYIYDAESALFGSTYSDIYDNSIRWTDGTIEVLLKSLASMGHLDDTLIVVTSDHGEAFLERGFEGHARRVYRETTEVPFILAFPFRLSPGIVVPTRTSNIDVLPTLLDLLGLEAPQGIDGRSRVPELLASARGETLDTRDQITFAELDQHWGQSQKGPLPAIAVVQDSLRYVRTERPDGARLEQLFDAREDPKEFRDLAETDAETLARLRALADEHAESRPAWGDAPTREISELELNLLRALGYAIE